MAAEEDPFEVFLQGLDPTVRRLVEDLKAKLAARKGRVLDMFRSWDVNQDGQVSVKEFQKAVKKLNLGFPEDVVEALFSSMDGDGSGQLDLEELNQMLTGTRPRRDTIERLKESKAKQEKLKKLHAQSLEAATKIARGKAIGEEALKSDLLAKLSARKAKVIDLITSWDEDASKTVSLEEFSKAVKGLKLSFADDIVQALFSSMDTDGTGEVKLLQLEKELVRARPRRDTMMRLKLSKAKHEAKVVPPFRVGFSSSLAVKSYNRKPEKMPFGSSSRRDKYTSWIGARSGAGDTPPRVGPGRYPQIEV